MATTYPVFANGSLFKDSSLGSLASVYSDVQTNRLNHPLPSVLLKSPFKLLDGPKNSATGNPYEIAKLFPNLFGQPSAKLVSACSDRSYSPSSLKIGLYCLVARLHVDTM
ncbi:hypothetical protein ZIOFF_027270 [Zingiber officinale]|uniref:Uncharacterized protein n=1 Tax=Zingiber officinale TaxID=94328 RepID=A0A8J5GYJ3_ZINOF|nr:hypothetical protein ZIOFF_027270 [Zingiber officinale]